MTPQTRHILKAVTLLTLLLAMLVPTVAEAQLLWHRGKTKRGLPNLPKYDRKLFHFGFTLGMNFTDFVVGQRDQVSSTDTVFVAESVSQPGFNLGIVSDLRVGKYFNLRFIPGISFVGRKMDYTQLIEDTVPVVTTKPTESVYFQFPLLFKFKSRRLGNFRAYIIAGGKFSIDMSSQEEVEDTEEQLLKLKKFDYTYDMGVGADFYLEYFKLGIEAKVSFGLNNML
ncbi:MAG: hypothetical protein ACI9P8_001237, partial [Bacteroidia bacterium]